MEPCLSPSTGSICPLRGRDKEANSKTGKQLQLGRSEVLQTQPRLPLLGRNSRKETDKLPALRYCNGRASLGRCAHVRKPSVTSGLRRIPDPLWLQASLPQATAGSPSPPNACPCLGRCGWGRSHGLRSQSRDVCRLLGLWKRVRAGASSSSLPPQLHCLPPTLFRPAAVSEIARRPRIH